MTIELDRFFRWQAAQVESLIGKTLRACYQNTGLNSLGDALIFEVDDKEIYVMYHYQDCCESVELEEVVGDLEDLVGTPILLAEEVSNEKDIGPKNHDESYTWTFYKFSTIKGSVTLRWYGSSNGYYSERVDFVRVLDQ